MDKRGKLKQLGTGAVLLDQVKWCSSFWCKLAGLMFRRKLRPGEGLLMVEPIASQLGPAIHMLFMAFPIAAIWLNDELRVVDKALAKPWRLFYAPAKPAKYTLEGSPSLLDSVNIGDLLEFES